MYKIFILGKVLYKIKKGIISDITLIYNQAIVSIFVSCFIFLIETSFYC